MIFPCFPRLTCLTVRWFCSPFVPSFGVLYIPFSCFYPCPLLIGVSSICLGFQSSASRRGSDKLYREEGCRCLATKQDNHKVAVPRAIRFEPVFKGTYGLAKHAALPTRASITLSHFPTTTAESFQEQVLSEEAPSL